MSTLTQKAVFVYEVGKPVQLGERGIPLPKVNEVLVKVTSAQLLPHDAYGRDKGLFFADKLPWVLGSSIAGVVEEAGPGVTAFKPGDRVFGISNLGHPTPDQAGLQQHAILQADSIGHVPANFSFTNDQLATLPINIVTTALALFTSTFGFDFPAPWASDKASALPDPEEPMVVLGAGTNAAKLFIHLATRVLGVRNIIAVADPANTAELERAGARHVIDRHATEASTIAQVHAAAGGADRVARVMDCASWEHSLATALLVRDQPSRLVTLHVVNEALVQVGRPLCHATIVQCSNANMGDHAAPFWRELPHWLEQGIVEPTAFRTLDGLEDVDAINKQLDEYAAGKGFPQLVVHP